MSPWARERLERWRERFPDTASFQRRLSAAGIDEARLLALLEAGPEDGRACGEPPEWWRDVVDAYGRAPPARPRPPDAAPDAKLLRGCARLVRPLLLPALDRLAATPSAREAAAGAMADPRATARALLDPLAGELVAIAIRVVVLELNVAALEDDGAADRFLAGLEDPAGALALLDEYPVLARLLQARVELGLAAAAELLGRLTHDAQVLRHAGLIGAEPLSIAASERLGDSHDGGRAVTLLTMVGGRRVVYKPRPLAMEVAYHRLLRRLCDAGLRPSMRPLRMLDRGGYGWQQAVDHESLVGERPAQRFYARLGAQLAVVYALWGTDIHRDNVIAAGEQPVLVDLETLLHPRVGGGDAAWVDPLTAATSPQSVTRVALLPGPDRGLGMDYSGLGSGPEPEVEQLRLEAAGADPPRLVQRRAPPPAGHNRPSQEAAAWRHVDDLCGGFRDAYRLLAVGREELLARGGPLQAMAAAEGRAVMRPTLLYAKLLAETLVPDALRDALERDRRLDGLWVATRKRPDLPALIPAELGDLRAGDVPRFRFRPGSPHVWHHSAGRIDDVFAPGCTPAPRACLERLDERDLARQLAFLRSAVSLTDPRAAWPSAPIDPAAAPARPVDLVAASAAIADRLGVLALRGGAEAGWLAPTRLDDRLVMHDAGVGLADGAAGIALFLAFHAELAPDPRAGELARAAATSVSAAAASGELDSLGPGALAGGGGVVWALAQLGGLWRDTELLGVAHELAKALLERIEPGCASGLADGIAGVGAGLLALAAPAPGIPLEDALRRCAALLTQRPAGAAEGFATGSAGVACVLLDLARATDSPADTAAALAMLDEMGGKEPHDDQRARARGPADPPSGSLLSGAAGRAIALARGQAVGPTPGGAAALQSALAGTQRHALGHDDSLGHGAFGAVEALTSGARALGAPAIAARAARLGAALARRARQDGPVCGTPGAVEHPGLVAGLAGVGLGLLRLSAPGRVPSLPGVSAPRARG